MTTRNTTTQRRKAPTLYGWRITVTEVGGHCYTTPTLYQAAAPDWLAGVQADPNVHHARLEKSGKIVETFRRHSESESKPECPEGFFWDGRQCLRSYPYPTLTLYEREGF